MLTEEEALLRVEAYKLDELLHPVFDIAEEQKAKAIAKGLPASPGAATGKIVFFADEAAEWVARGKKLSWFVLKLHLKTLVVWMLPKVFLPHVVV
jgi:pyruvate, orthophosphate dikinase